MILSPPKPPDLATLAPFAAFPKKFWACGRCHLCQQFAWIENLIVWPADGSWPPIYTDSRYLCEDCMVVLGVGTGW